MNGFSYFIEQLELITAMTKLLNSDALPSADGVYLHVELRETHSGQTVGEWSDEIAGDCWAYAEKAQDAGSN